MHMKQEMPTNCIFLFIETIFQEHIISYKGPVLWNSFPDDFKLSPTVQNFKRKYKFLSYNQ